MLMHQRGDLAAHCCARIGVALLQGLIGKHKVYFVCAICQGLLRLRQHIRQLEKVVAEQKKELECQRGRESRVFAVGGDGSVFVVARESIRSQLPDEKPRRSGEIVVWRPARTARETEFSSDARATGLDDAV